MAQISDHDSVEIRKLLGLINVGIFALVEAVCSPEQVKDYRENLKTIIDAKAS